MRTEIVREEVLRLVRRKPFQPFVLNMENGDRITIEHPENIAFNPKPNGELKKLSYFYAISGELNFHGTFEAVTSIALLDTEGKTEE